MQQYTVYSNQQLLSLITEDDEQAFAEIYQRYWKRMLAMASLRLQRTDIAEDIVQDVFASLWQRRKEANIQSLENWLATAVKYKVITSLKCQLKAEISPATDLAEPSFSDTTIDERFLQQLINEEINRLPEKCRLVFRYSREMGLSNGDIASRLHISEKAVEKHITTARQRLSLSLRHLLHSVLFL